jgi:hypothetical protein
VGSESAAAGLLGIVCAPMPFYQVEYLAFPSIYGIVSEE